MKNITIIKKSRLKADQPAAKKIKKTLPPNG
jgi:hypothetical protein